MHSFNQSRGPRMSFLKDLRYSAPNHKVFNVSKIVKHRSSCTRVKYWVDESDRFSYREDY